MQQIETTISVFGKDCKVTVLGNEKGTWWASGFYEDQYFKSEFTKSFNSAIRRWKEKAKVAADF